MWPTLLTLSKSEINFKIEWVNDKTLNYIWTNELG